MDAPQPLPPPAVEPLTYAARAQSRLNELADLAAAGVAAGLVSHEVRNLLTPAVAHVQLCLRDKGLSASSLASLEKALLSMRRACEVAELVLAADRKEPRADECEVAPVVAECLSILGWGDEGPVRIKIHVPEGLAVGIGQEALRHVLLNLLLNARASLPREGGTIEIAAARSARNVELSIRDTGHGIPAEAMQRIQQHLLGTQGPPSPPPSGGLGLLLCRRLLDANRGTLSLTSEPRRGTTARILLPLPNTMQTSMAA